MLRYFSYIAIILCIIPACQVTQVSVPDAFDTELKESENIQSASAEIRLPSVVREPSGLSGYVSDAPFSTDQTWVEEMITAPGEGNDGSQIGYGEGIYMGAINNYTGPCVLLESERSGGWFSNRRFLSRYGRGHVLDAINRSGSEPESAVAITPALNPQDEEPDEREIPPSAVFGIILALLPFLSIFGIIFSIIALIRIDNHPDIYKGTGLAVAGLLLSVIMSIAYMAMAAATAEVMVGILLLGMFGG